MQVVLLGLTISTCMLLRLALKPRGGGASLADIERAEDLLVRGFMRPFHILPHQPRMCWERWIGLWLG